MHRSTQSRVGCSNKCPGDSLDNRTCHYLAFQIGGLAKLRARIRVDVLQRQSAMGVCRWVSTYTHHILSRAYFARHARAHVTSYFCSCPIMTIDEVEMFEATLRGPAN